MPALFFELALQYGKVVVCESVDLFALVWQSDSVRKCRGLHFNQLKW